MISANKIIGSLVYRTREALSKNRSFLKGLQGYTFAPSLFMGDRFNFWHYPGTHNEISNVFMTLSNSGGNYLKYPALLNFQTIRQTKGPDGTWIYYNLAFVCRVESTWLTEERERQVFDCVLRPVYEEFMSQIEKSGYFLLDFGLIPHDYYEVFTTDANAGKLVDRYGEHIDAIEIHGLRLKLQEDICPDTERQIIKENDLVTEKLK